MLHEEETENKMLSRKLRRHRGLNEENKNQERKLEKKMVYNGIKKIIQEFLKTGVNNNQN